MKILSLPLPQISLKKRERETDRQGTPHPTRQKLAGKATPPPRLSVRVDDQVGEGREGGSAEIKVLSGLSPRREKDLIFPILSSQSILAATHFTVPIFS